MKKIKTQALNRDFVEIEIRRQLYAFDQYAILQSIEVRGENNGRVKWSATRDGVDHWWLTDFVVLDNGDVLTDWMHAVETTGEAMGTPLNFPSNVPPKNNKINNMKEIIEPLYPVGIKISNVRAVNSHDEVQPLYPIGTNVGDSFQLDYPTRMPEPTAMPGIRITPVSLSLEMVRRQLEAYFQQYYDEASVGGGTYRLNEVYADGTFTYSYVSLVGEIRTVSGMWADVDGTVRVKL
jgi:hypothetical protein